jgi:hypothetical protein
MDDLVARVAETAALLSIAASTAKTMTRLLIVRVRIWRSDRRDPRGT